MNGLHPTSQLIMRNAERLRDTRLLLFNPPADGLASALQREFGCRCERHTQHYGDYEALHAQGEGIDTQFGDWPGPGRPCPERVILFQPREKRLLQNQLARLAACLEKPGTLWLVGENRAGIKSCAQVLTRCFGATEKLDAARHCGLFESTVHPGRALPVESPESRYILRFRDRELEYCCPAGVFSYGKLDPGSRMLLESLESEPLGGRTLDYGCGNGVLGLSLARSDPRGDYTLIDSNALALAAARRNAAGLENVHVFASNGFSRVKGRFSVIVSNPPFHAGVGRTTAVPRDLVDNASRFLAPGGVLRIVANRNLPYRRWLLDRMGEVRVVAADPRFHVLQATRGG